MVGLFETLGLFILISSIVAIFIIAGYFDHKKNIAMIEKGLVPEDEKRRPENRVVSLSCLDELDLSVETGVLFQVTGQKIEPAPYMTAVQ